MYGLVAIFLGVIFFLIPWLPIGYIFLFIGSMLLESRIPLLRKLMKWLRKKDKKGRLQKVEDKVNSFFGTHEEAA